MVATPPPNDERVWQVLVVILLRVYESNTFVINIVVLSVVLLLG